MSPDGVISVEVARARMNASLTAIEDHEQVDLALAVGRILCEPLLAPFDIPAGPVSAMDGYALAGDVSRTLPFSLKTVGAALAGHATDIRVDAESTVRIMTGAMLPAGADTVVMQEQVEERGEQVMFVEPVRSGANVRLAGEDLAAGDLAVASARRLTAADLQRAASLGYARLRVRRKLKVAVLSSGDEVSPIGAPLALGAVYDSNRQFLLAALSTLQVSVIDLGIVPDQAHAIEASLNHALRGADLLITTGGASHGDADHISALLQRLGHTVFAGVAMKPGRPTRLALLERPVQQGASATRLAVLSLPGTPMAMLTAFHVFGVEAINTMQGSQQLGRRFSARLEGRLAGAIERTEYLAARLRYDQQGAIAKAPVRRVRTEAALFDASFDALLELPAGSGDKRPGDPVVVILL